jgi:hypothetical protein
MTTSTLQINPSSIIVSPTKTRIKAFLVDQGNLTPLFPSRVVIAIGISLTLCGVIMSIFGSVSFLIDLPFNSTGILVGLFVFFTGVSGVMSGNHPHVAFLLLTNLFLSIISVASSTFVIMLSVSSLMKDPDTNLLLQSNLELTKSSITSLQFPESKKPFIVINTFFLVMASITSILSFVMLSLTGREACFCYSSFSSFFGLDDPTDQLRLDTLQRKDRIIAWILEQSNSSNVDDISVVEAADFEVKDFHPYKSFRAKTSTINGGHQASKARRSESFKDHILWESVTKNHSNVNPDPEPIYAIPYNSKQGYINQSFNNDQPPNHPYPLSSPRKMINYSSFRSSNNHPYFITRNEKWRLPGVRASNASTASSRISIAYDV